MRAAAMLAAALVCSASGAGASGGAPKYLVYTRAVTAHEAVWIGDVEGRGMRRLARGAYGLVSPDGMRIAIARRAGIYVIAPDGRGGRFVARGKPAGWLPDSRHLFAFQNKAFVRIDVVGGAVDVVERGEVVDWSVSPDGATVAYDVYRERAPSGGCWFDIYTARVDGTVKRRLTTGARSSNPVWGSDAIAYAYRPPGTGCYEPRVWRMAPDGSDKEPVMRRLPLRFARLGYYGVRPRAWVQGRPLLVATIPTEWGLELAFVGTRRGRVRKPDLDPRPRYGRPMYVDDVSSDGRHMVGAACGAEAPCEIWTYSLGGRARRLRTGQVAYPDWNR
jgi:hypothetical protein